MPLKLHLALTAKDERAAADAVLPWAAWRLEKIVQSGDLIASRAAAVAAAAFAVAVCMAVARAVTIAAVRTIAVENGAAWAPAALASLAVLAALAAPAALALALALTLLGALFGALGFPSAAAAHPLRIVLRRVAQYGARQASRVRNGRDPTVQMTSRHLPEQVEQEGGIVRRLERVHIQVGQPAHTRHTRGGDGLEEKRAEAKSQHRALSGLSSMLSHVRVSGVAWVWRRRPGRGAFDERGKTSSRAAHSNMPLQNAVSSISPPCESLANSSMAASSASDSRYVSAPST